MTWSAHVLRTADDVSSTQGDICTSGGTIMVDTCGESDVTAIGVVQKLSQSDTALGVRLAEGKPFQVYSGSTWVNSDPTLHQGPMLCRALACKEHEDRPGLFQVDYETSGVGPYMSADSTPVMLGTPYFQVSTVSRPRMAAAYRSGCTIPSDDTIITSSTPHVFNVDTDWHDGQDIGGNPIDLNTAPMTIPIDQTVISFSYPIRYPYKDWEGWYGCRNLTVMNDAIGGRNAEPFLQFPKGSLMLESIDVQPMHHEFRMVTITLVYDQWHHAQQVPKVVAQFAAPTETDTTTLQSHAKYVFWQQSHPDLWYVNTTAGNASLQDLIDEATYFEYFARFGTQCS